MHDVRVAFVVTAEAATRLREWLRAGSTPQDLALRAKIVLLGGEGVSIRETAQRLLTTPKTVKLWRSRFRKDGVGGLLTAHRTGRPKTITVAKERSVVAATMRAPRNATHWSAERLAPHVGVSPRTVLRIWKKYGLQPHRVETFKFSTDPEFDAKLADVIGLYLDPPERALVLSVDEKSQIQALDRTQPILPMRPGVPARMTHDYKRNGTTSLFAALEVATGKVHGRCFAKHTHAEFIGFLEYLARTFPRRQLRLICDNYGTHKHPAVRDWLARHPRIRLHFTPTSASWLNQVERWFALITNQRIRRGTFESVRALERAITRYIDSWNEDARPFQWLATSTEIQATLQRKREVATSGARH